MQGGTCGTENCDGRGLICSAWPIRVGWVAGSRWMPIWLTNADQLRSAHAEPGSQSNQPQSARVTCGSSVKSVFWIWSLRPGCSKVSWDSWNTTIAEIVFLSRVMFDMIVENIWPFIIRNLAACSGIPFCDACRFLVIIFNKLFIQCVCFGITKRN